MSAFASDLISNLIGYTVVFGFVLFLYIRPLRTKVERLSDALAALRRATAGKVDRPLPFCRCPACAADRAAFTLQELGARPAVKTFDDAPGVLPGAMIPFDGDPAA